MAPDKKYELEAYRSGIKLVAGVDEAGRGPLAGPVVAAAVILYADTNFSGLNDSKLLTARQREKLFSKIRQEAYSVSVSIIPPQTIDDINILQATRLAMKNAVAGLNPYPELLLIDGPISLDLDVAQRPIIKGDKLSTSIAAASVIAKVTRDDIMLKLHQEFPQYRFDKNKGYGTKEHTLAILKHGPCPVHRRKFGLVKHFFQRKLFDI
ncbi:MAG: ribonuclease HII [Desulfomonilaceae bacterium]